MLKFAIPVLHVSNAVAAERFYLGLGFEQVFAMRPDDSKPDPCYMGFRRDDAVLHVSSFSGDSVAGGAVYVAVDNVDDLHREFVANGIPIDTDPIDQSWGTREMYVKDADRNSIRFTQDLH